MTFPVPYLDGDTLQRWLTPERALAAVQEYFRVQRREDVAVPDRIHLQVPGTRTVGLYMPAATPEFIGVKLAHLMPHRTPNVEAEAFLYEAATGKLLFWCDGKPLTALRTAAVSCAASLRLAPDLRRVLVFGAGLQAEAHIRALASAYPGLTHIRVAARSRDSFDRLRRNLGPGLDALATPSHDARRDLGQADAVVTTTPAPAPLFQWRDAPGPALVVAVGSATPYMHELPVEAFMACEVWLDSSRALSESGDCISAENAGWNPSDVRGDLFDLLRAQPQARSRDGRAPALFKSAGHAAQDLALLIALWRDMTSGTLSK